MTVTAADLGDALACVEATLRPHTHQDWTRPAGELDWDCRQTAEHVGDVLMSYAAQVVSRPRDHYVRFLAKADEGATPEELLELALTGARLLRAAIATSAPEARAYHPTGFADPEGFAAMGCAELLLHGDDLARGVGTQLDPPREVCARVVARLFPDEAPASDPWDGLRWCAGRIELPGRSRRAEWKWRGAPLN
ncbi:maleylpyruvate isomerase N-terminal domain-containing protein [Amycolatopsis sp. NPDC004368]